MLLAFSIASCGVLKVKTLNGKNAQEVDNVAHTICDNLKNKFPYEYKVYSPNFENSRQAASSVKTQQTAKKTIEKNVSDKNYEKFKKFCDNTKLLSSFKSWADTNSAPLIKQLGITYKKTLPVRGKAGRFEARISRGSKKYSQRKSNLS